MSPASRCGTAGRSGSPVAVPLDPVRRSGPSALCLQRVGLQVWPGPDQGSVQLVDPVAQQRVLPVRGGDRGAVRPGRARRCEVEHALAEPCSVADRPVCATCGGSSVTTVAVPRARGGARSLADHALATTSTVIVVRVHRLGVVGNRAWKPRRCPAPRRPGRRSFPVTPTPPAREERTRPGGRAWARWTDAVRHQIAVLSGTDLETWQRPNVTGFLPAVIARNPELLATLRDADGTPYLPMFPQPVLVFLGAQGVLAAAHERAVRRGLPRPSTPPRFSAPATTRRTGRWCAPCPLPSWTWSGWPYTDRATPWTRSSRAQRCTADSSARGQRLHAQGVARRGAGAAGALGRDEQRRGVARRVHPQPAHRRRPAGRGIEVGHVDQLQLRPGRRPGGQPDRAAALALIAAAGPTCWPPSP